MDILDAEVAPNAYELKCIVADIEPPIWRRLRIPGDYTLADLHTVLQTLFAWGDDHLHRFVVDGEQFSEIDDEYDDEDEFEDEADVTLDELELTKKSKILYNYDFGDDWEVNIKVEKIESNDPSLTIPICLAGERAGPPDDSGGVPGYEHLVEVLGNPGHPDYEDRLDWLGYDFDPEMFDIDLVNGMLADLTPKPGLPLPWIDKAAERMAKAAADAAAPPPTDEEWKALYQAAHRYGDAAPWKSLGSDFNEFIQNPETGENCIFVIIGEGAEVQGFSLYRGDRGFDSYLRTSGVGLVDETDLFIIQDSIGVTFVKKKELEEDEVERFKSLKLRYTGKSAWPSAKSFDPGYATRRLNGAEARFLTLGLNRVIEIATTHRQDTDETGMLELEGAVPLHVLEDGKWRIESHVPELAEIEIPATLPTENVIKDLLKLTMSDGVLEIDFWSLPQPLDDETGRVVMTFAVSGADANSLEPVALEVTPFDKLLDTSMKVFIDVLSKVEMRPSIVAVRRPELAALFTPLTNRLECKIVLKPDLESSAMAQLSMLAAMAGLSLDDLAGD